MDELHIKKTTVIAKLTGLIAEEEKFVDETLKVVEERAQKSLRRVRNAAMQGKSEPGSHLGFLKELRHRYSNDARDAIPLSHSKYGYIMDGVGGGKERLLRVQAETEIDWMNRMLNLIGLPKLPLSTEDLIIHAADCSDLDCPIHGAGGVLRRLLGSREEVGEPVGKIGVQGVDLQQDALDRAADSDDPGDANANEQADAMAFMPPG